MVCGLRAHIKELRRFRAACGFQPCSRNLRGFPWLLLRLQPPVPGRTHPPSPRETNSVYDLTILLDDRPGALAEMGDALGRAGVSVEGGGAWLAGGRGIAHFLFEDGEAARAALKSAGITVADVRPVVTLRLDQAAPGQLGRATRRMADAGVNIQTLYSDHDHRLILVVDDEERGRAVAAEWAREHPHLAAAEGAR
jgi:hypothetical protein